MFKSNSIAVLSLNDQNELKRESELIAKVSESEINPIQRITDRCFSYARYIYDNYLYSTGTLFIGALFWTFYPTYARYRHAHFWRYRKNQIRVLQYVFGTEHIPTWNKKYLHRITIPLTANTFYTQEKLIDVFKHTEKNKEQINNTLQNEDASGSPSLGNRLNNLIVEREYENAKSSLLEQNSQRCITIEPSESGKFYNWWSKESYKKLVKEIEILNHKLQEVHDFGVDKTDHKLFAINKDRNNYTGDDETIDDGKLRSIVKDLVERCDSSLILVQSHRKVVSVPSDYEVWWVSAEERHRRNFCWYALTMLAFLRCMQDLTYLPEMPDPKLGEDQSL